MISCFSSLNVLQNNILLCRNQTIQQLVQIFYNLITLKSLLLILTQAFGLLVKKMPIQYLPGFNS